MELSKAAFPLALMLVCINSHAGIFGPSDAGECLEKYWPRVRLEDARDVVVRACGIGYSNPELDDEVKVASKCIVKKSEEMYSFESTLRVINNCTKKNSDIFKYYQDILMQRAVATVELQKRQSRIDRYLNRPTTLIDINTGLPRPCQQIGNVLHCD